MSEVNFNDYVNYANYNSNYDFSALMGGTTNSSGDLLSDYASIKNGSYGKLVKAYYAKQDAENASMSGDSAKKLTFMRSNAESLKKSADALNDSTLWEKKKMSKIDEETGEETEAEDYDWDAITKALKSFISDYNAVVEQAGDSDTKSVLRNATWMTGVTDSVKNLLSKAGITIGKGNKLVLDEDTLKKADVTTLKSIFTGSGSFADRISQKADSLSKVANSEAAKAKGRTYTSKGGYSDTLSKLYSSTVDEKIGSKDKSINKNAETFLKTTDKIKEKEDEEKKSKKSE